MRHPKWALALLLAMPLPAAAQQLTATDARDILAVAIRHISPDPRTSFLTAAMVAPDVTITAPPGFNLTAEVSRFTGIPHGRTRGEHLCELGSSGTLRWRAVGWDRMVGAMIQSVESGGARVMVSFEQSGVIHSNHRMLRVERSADGWRAGEWEGDTFRAYTGVTGCRPPPPRSLKRSDLVSLVATSIHAVVDETERHLGVEEIRVVCWMDAYPGWLGELRASVDAELERTALDVRSMRDGCIGEEDRPQHTQDGAPAAKLVVLHIPFAGPDRALVQVRPASLPASACDGRPTPCIRQCLLERSNSGWNVMGCETARYPVRYPTRVGLRSGDEGPGP